MGGFCLKIGKITQIHFLKDLNTEYHRMMYDIRSPLHEKNNSEISN
jgi:hypothetical protein